MVHTPTACLQTRPPITSTQEAEDQRHYLFAAIDRATRWVYVGILIDKSTAVAGFLMYLINTAPFTIRKILTDNRRTLAEGAHASYQVCTDNRIEHHLTKPRTPQTKSMIKRFKAASPMCYAPTALTRLPPTGNP